MSRIRVDKDCKKHNIGNGIGERYMVYSKYGHTFRKIREQKKLSLANFPQIGISKPALSKFERGETMMGFENVVCALQGMGVSLEEYENFLNGYTAGEEEELWEEIEKAHYQANQHTLQKLQKYTTESDFYFMELSIKACLGSLTSQEVEEITEYLYDVEIWSFMELRLFYFSVEYLNYRDLLHIFNSFFPQGHELFNSKKHLHFFVQICCRAIAYFSSKGYKKESQMLLDQLDAHNLVQTIFQRHLKQITEGYWLSKFGDQLKGEEQILDSLRILSVICSKDEVSYYKKKYGF